MYIAVTIDPVQAIRAEARRAAARRSPAVLLRRWVEHAWARRRDRQVEHAVVTLGHAGLLDELREARRRG